MFVGADQHIKLAHYVDGDMEILPEDTEIKGFSAEGIAEWLYIWLNHYFNINEMLENYDFSKIDFINRIVDALEELGFYNHEGNIS